MIRQLDANARGQTRVVMGPLRALAKRLKADHEFAQALWATARSDAELAQQTSSRGAPTRSCPASVPPAESSLTAAS